jgi:hypothetical protein
MALVLRSGKPPIDQLDFDDRHDAWATEGMTGITWPWAWPYSWSG